MLCPKGGDVMAMKRLFTKLTLALLMIAVLLPNIFVVAFATELEAEKTNQLQEVSVYNAVTTASGLNVRSEPTVNSPAINLLLRGTPITVLEEVETGDEINPIWLKIIYDSDKSGYVSKRYVEFLEYNDYTGKTYGLTTPAYLNMRKEATTNSKSLMILRKGSYVTVLSEKKTNDYYKIWYEIDYNGQRGWIAGTYVDLFEWELITQVSTTSHGSSSNRNHNMELASSTLTGTLVLPEKSFSWVKTMGSCSASKGYLEAPVYVRGKLVNGYGGGVCQVSTTINIAAKSIGIATNARPHSGRVAYASIEDEATVSYPYTDFSFTNTLGKPILLELVSSNGTVVCNIYAQKQ